MIPSDKRWQSIMPDWIKSRKSEVIERIKQQGQAYKLIFEEYEDGRDVPDIAVTESKDYHFVR